MKIEGGKKMEKLRREIEEIILDTENDYLYWHAGEGPYPLAELVYDYLEMDEENYYPDITDEFIELVEEIRQEILSKYEKNCLHSSKNLIY